MTYYFTKYESQVIGEIFGKQILVDQKERRIQILNFVMMRG